MMYIIRFRLLIFRFLFLVLLPVEVRASIEDKINPPVVIRDNPVGITISNKKVHYIKNANTHLFLGQHYSHFPQQLSDIVLTSIAAIPFIFPDYLYVAITGSIANMIHKRNAESLWPDSLKSSASVVSEAVSALGYLFLFEMVSEKFKEKNKDDQVVLDKRNACNLHQKRNGSMPVYPQHSWLGSHFYQQIQFSENQNPALQINLLQSPEFSPDDETSVSISEWVRLYNTLARLKIDQIIIQPNESGLELTFKRGAIVKELLLFIDAPNESSISWDINVTTSLCSFFEASSVYSLFHKETLKAITLAIHKFITVNDNISFFSPNKNNVIKSEAGAAVIRLEDNLGSPWLVYSDRDFFSENFGYFLLTEPEQKAQNLFSLALHPESNSIAQRKSSQKIWHQKETAYLVSILKWITIASLYKNIQNRMNSAYHRSSFADQHFNGNRPSSEKNVIVSSKNTKSGQLNVIPKKVLD